jgi:hypothetical protein
MKSPQGLFASSLLTSILVGWCGAAAVLFGVGATCAPPPPGTAVDVAAAVECVASEELKGITDPNVIYKDCKLASAQVASDILSTMNLRAARMCATPVHPVAPAKD